MRSALPGAVGAMSGTQATGRLSWQRIKNNVKVCAHLTLGPALKDELHNWGAPVYHCLWASPENHAKLTAVTHFGAVVVLTHASDAIPVEGLPSLCHWNLGAKVGVVGADT